MREVLVTLMPSLAAIDPDWVTRGCQQPSTQQVSRATSHVLHNTATCVLLWSVPQVLPAQSSTSQGTSVWP